MISPRLASNPIERLSRGKGGSLDWAGCSKSPSSKAVGESKLEAYPLGYVEDFDESRTKLADFFSSLPLLNACLALLPPDILHDLINICRSDGVDLRHVAEFPVVRLDAVGRRPFESLIPVMVWLVNFMH